MAVAAAAAAASSAAAVGGSIIQGPNDSYQKTKTAKMESLSESE